MIYVFIANGFEEVEALTPVNLLRRCELDVVTVGIDSQVVKGSHGISVLTDIDDKQVTLNDSVDMIVLPGGMPGTLNLENNSTVQNAIDFCVKNNKYIAAICAAPSILGHKNLLNGKNATCFPGFEEQLLGAKYSEDLVIVDEKIITAKGAGAAMKFSLKLCEIMTSKERAKTLEESLQCN
ncbi:MAG: DJ-1/PfpI family protein [Clostridiales bacterium]|nr:DJ-1/PfpI family protein [Clostridiales bacterium]